MSILVGELSCCGSAVMPDTDATLDIGGAIDRTTSVEFEDVAGALQAVSDSAGDVTQSVTVTYRDAAGVALTLALALNGQTVVSDATVVERLLKAVKDLSCAGNVAVESAVAVQAGTAAGGGVNYITLDAGASAVDDFYRGMVVRETNGAKRVRRVVFYTGATKKATVDQLWGGSPPDGTTTFRVSNGFYLAKAPTEVMEVRRPFYAATSDPVVAKTYYEKVFLTNDHATLTLTAAEVSEFADPEGDVEFALETTLDGAGTNGGANNRQVAPSAGVGAFDSAAKATVGGTVPAGSAQGVWLKLSLGIGAAAQNSSYTPQLGGSTT